MSTLAVERPMLHACGRQATVWAVHVAKPQAMAFVPPLFWSQSGHLLCCAMPAVEAVAISTVIPAA